MHIIDLHTHSTASDGSLSPRELVRHAYENNLSAIALTDHDTMEGIAEALDEGAAVGLEVVPGVEISADSDTEMHILGYFPDRDYSGMKVLLSKLRDSRNRRNPKMLARLNELGFQITMQEVEEEAGGSIIARPHFASVMVKKGYVQSIREAFDKYLSEGKPAYIKRDKLMPEEGMKAIRTAGGIPVLAHPKYLGLGEEEMDELLAEMKAAGMAGLEVYYVENTPSETELYLKLAQKHGLAATGGSDFHGSFKPDIEIGTGHGNLSVPYRLLETLKIL